MRLIAHLQTKCISGCIQSEKFCSSNHPCNQQVLSPQDLQRVASDATCMDAVDEWWRRFHKIERVLVDFEYVFIRKFDTVEAFDKYSVKFDVDQCKVRRPQPVILQLNDNPGKNMSILYFPRFHPEMMGLSEAFEFAALNVCPTAVD